LIEEVEPAVEEVVRGVDVKLEDVPVMVGRCVCRPTKYMLTQKSDFSVVPIEILGATLEEAR
jgi:hypothetical protein